MFQISRFLAESSKQSYPINYLTVRAKSRFSFPESYPQQWEDNSNVKKLETEKLNAVKEGKFEGFIPIDKIDIKYSTSSPERSATDNLSKNQSRVEIRFDVKTAEWIPQNLRDIILKKETRMVDGEGYMTAISDRTRKQMLNQADCLRQIREQLFFFRDFINKKQEKSVSEKQEDNNMKQTYKGIKLYRHVPVDLSRKEYTNNFKYTDRERAILNDRLLEEQRHYLSIYKNKRSPKEESSNESS